MCNDLVWQRGSQAPRIGDTARFLSAHTAVEAVKKY